VFQVGIAPRRWSYVIAGRALLAAVVLAACGDAHEAAPRATTHRDPERLAARFKQDLQAALRAGLAQGPAEAVAACQLRAPEIATSLSREGVRVGRTSHRLRNPSNSPPEWVSPILDAYLAEPSDRAPKSTTLPNGNSGYAEPLLTQPLCLTCHGQVLAPDVAARIRELYPEDEAVGFEVGDLRGVLWVELPATE